MITKNQLKTNLPKVISDKYGCVNVVLALRKDSTYCKSNLYLPKWCVVNTAYYNQNSKDYEGWIGLENCKPDEMLKIVFGEQNKIQAKRLGCNSEENVI